MSNRNYNRLYVHTDREEGSEKILLGYQNDLRENILYKDKEVYLHVPFFTKAITLNNSTLINDGATAGPFPAAADRIFKNNKGFGESTTNGIPSTITDGGWFCSWLYRDELGKAIWMDRYYNPGKFVITLATTQLAEGPPYRKHNPVFYDVPSTMVFESGVQYKYFHVGEKTAKDIITTYGGLTGERVQLNLNGWGTKSIDSSQNNIDVKITTTGPIEELFDIGTESTEHLYSPTLNFNNAYDSEVYVNYNSSYALANEFTLAFWAQSNNWNLTPSTQLVGNFSSKGGYGVFIDTLSSYPFFVIPETAYGHLLYVNEKLNQFLDKSLHLTTALTATPALIALDSDTNVIVCNSDNTRTITKYDNAGEILCQTALPSLTEELIQLICGPNDSFTVITNSKRYTYNSNLELISTTFWQSSTHTVAAYAYDIEADTSELISFDNVYDSKYIETTHWCISATDGNLYKKTPSDSNYILMHKFEEHATTFGIDPYNRLWVLHGNNNVSVFDSKMNPLANSLFEFDSGQNTSYRKKNINFICSYDRTTKQREWRCLIYCATASEALSNPQLFVYDMDGLLIQAIDILSFFNLNVFRLLNQEQSKVEFFSKGDFTGYEYRRVFNNLSPFKNSPQLIIKASLRDKAKQTIPFVQFKKYFSLASWNYNNWQHIVLTLKNRKFELYANANKCAEMDYSGKYEISYETQPTLFIGAPGGSRYGFNREIACPSAIFNGKFQDIVIYDYAIEESRLEMFLRAAIAAQDIYWSLPTPVIQYIEKIERMFKNKIPGAKSSFFNIKLRGTEITDKQTRILIEQELRSIVSKAKPLYADFLQVQWID